MALPMHADRAITVRLMRLLIPAAAALMLWGGVRGAPARAAETPANLPPTDTATDDQADQTDIRGVDLGTYLVRAYYPVEAQKSVVSFTLYATVEHKDAAEFDRLLESRRHKVRDQVIIATRLVPVADFNDPQLESFRRRILLRLHRTMPELPVQDAYLSHFQFEVESL